MLKQIATEYQCNKSKAEAVIEISDEEDSKPEDEPVQQSDQEGSGTMKNAGFDGSPLTIAVIECAGVTVSPADGTRTNQKQRASQSLQSLPTTRRLWKMMAC